MTLALVIDTAFETCQIGVFRDGRCVAEKRALSGGRHDHVLATMVRDLLAENDVVMSTIDQMVVTTGPGRFTGLRVGIAFVRGLALVHGTPVTGVSTMDALQVDMAGQAQDATALVVCVKKGESFVRLLADAAQTIHVVPDAQAVAFFADHGVGHVAGVYSPWIDGLIAQGSVAAVAGVTEPSLAAIARCGIEKEVSDGMAEIVRPYYAA